MPRPPSAATATAPPTTRAITPAMRAAARCPSSQGDVDGLRRLLSADVQLVGDGGGKAPQLARALVGAEQVARLLATVYPLMTRIDITFDPHDINGQPGAVFRDRDGKVLLTLTLDILDGRIQTIRSVINPDKLSHLGPVADAWSIDREVKRTRRTTQ